MKYNFPVRVIEESESDVIESLEAVLSLFLVPIIVDLIKFIFKEHSEQQ